jgi:hypothetical protein
VNMQQRAAQVRDAHPYPSADPLQRLRHTVSVFADAPDDEVVVMATNGIYPTGDTLDGRSTGLTHGDLRALLARLGGLTR